MKYKPVDKKHRSMTERDKKYFLSGFFVFVISLILAKPINNINKYLPGIIILVSGFYTAVWSYLIIVKYKHDREDKLCKRFEVVPILAAFSLIIFLFLLFVLIFGLLALKAKKTHL